MGLRRARWGGRREKPRSRHFAGAWRSPECSRGRQNCSSGARFRGQKAKSMCKTTVDRGWADPLYEVPPVGRRVFQSADGLCSASGSGLCQSWLYMEPASSARGGRRRAGCRTPCSRQGTGRSCDRASRLAFSANMMRTVMDKKRWFLRFSGPKRPFACALRPMFERNAWSKARTVSLSSNGNRETARFCPELTDLSAKPGSPQTGLVRRARLRRRFGRPCPSGGEELSEAPDRGRFGSRIGEYELVSILV